MRTLASVLIAVMIGVCGCSGSREPAGSDAARSGGGAAPSLIPLMPPGPSKPSGTTAERVEAAKGLAADGAFPKAIETLEEGLMIDANDRESLGLLAQYLKDRAKEVESAGTPEYYQRLVSAAEYYRRLREHYPDLTAAEKALGLELFYEEATAHAKSLRVEETTGSLRDLVGAGFKDFDRIRKDPAWAKIQELPEFQKEFKAISESVPVK